MSKAIKRVFVMLLLCAIISANFFVSKVSALDDTTWQYDWQYSTSMYNDEPIIILSYYKGTTKNLTVPAKAVMGGVEYQVWIRRPDRNPSWYEPILNSYANNYVTSITFEEGVKAGYNLTRLFAGLYLEKIDLSGLDTTNTVNMQSMFDGCWYLEELELGKINTSNVTNMVRTFAELESLESLDISSIDLSGIVLNRNATRGMFKGSFMDLDFGYKPLNKFGEAMTSPNPEYPYPVWAEWTQGEYGILGPEEIERAYCLNLEVDNTRAIPGDGGVQFYKLISAEDYIGSNYKFYTEQKLTEDDIAKIATAIIFVDEIESSWWQNKHEVVQNVIWHITNNHELSSTAEKYYNNVVLQQYQNIKGNFDMHVYVPEDKKYQNVAGNVQLINSFETSLKGKKVLEGHDFKEGDEFTFTLTSTNKKAPMPENCEITINPTSGNEIEFSFEKIMFNTTHIGKTFTYRVVESGYGKNIINDTKDHIVNVTVKSIDGKLVVESEYSDGNEFTFTNRFFDGFLIRKIDQFKNPLKGIKFAVYGKPTISAETKLKITKVRNYEMPDLECEECPPIWKSVYPDPCQVEKELTIDDIYIQSEITVLVEGIDNPSFREEYVIASGVDSVELSLKTGKYRISEIVPEGSTLDSLTEARQQSYLKSYEIEVDELGDIKAIGNEEWSWLTFTMNDLVYTQHDNPFVKEWNEKVSVELKGKEVVITNYAAFVEHKLTLTKVKDHPKECPTNACVPQNPEEPQESCDLPCELTEDEIIDYYYLVPDMTMIVRNFGGDHYCKKIKIESGTQSKELKIKPGIYLISELYEIPEKILLEQEQSYLSSYVIEVTNDGQIIEKEKPTWLWMSYYEDPSYPEYSGYNIWGYSDYGSEEKVSVELVGNEVKVTNYAYKVPQQQ